MPRFQRLDIWSNLAAAGGLRIAAIPDLTALGDVRKLSGDDELTLVLPSRLGTEAIYTLDGSYGLGGAILLGAGDAVPYRDLLEGRVLTVVYADGSFDEWRIVGIHESHAAEGKLTMVTAVPPLGDLARTLVGRTEADGLVHYDFEGLQLTATQHCTSLILPALAADGFGYFALGTIETTWPIDVVYQWTTPLAALRQIAQTTGMEFRIRRNGTTNYLIDLVSQIGSAAAVVDVRLGKNLQGIRRARSAVEQMTRVYPKGTVESGFAASMARAVWEVVSIAGSIVRLKDAAGGDGPAQFADQLNGRYLRTVGGTLTLISATTVISALLTDVTVASATGFTVGDLVQLRKDAAGTDLTYLDAPAAQTTYGLIAGVIDRADIPDTLNVVKNPALRAWAGAASDPPDNWTKLGTPTLTRTTTAGRWRSGGQSCRVQATADGQGLETTSVTIAPSAASPFFSGHVSVWIETGGQVRLELIATDGVTTYSFPDIARQKAWTSQQKRWVDLGVGGIDFQALAITQVKLRIIQDGATATDFYVDAAQIVQWASNLPFIEGAGGTKLWQAANDALIQAASPIVTYEIDLLDLTRLEPKAWPYDELTLGGALRVTDPGLAIVTTVRVVELHRDLLKAGDSQVVLASRPRDLADQLAASRPFGRPPLEPLDLPVGPKILSATVDVHSDGSVTATLQADESTGSIKVVGRKTAFPSLADVRARTAVAGKNVSTAVVDAATGVAMVLDLAEVAYVSALAYEQLAGAGLEGPLAQARGVQPLKKTTLTKTLTIPFGELIPESDLTQWLIFTTGYIGSRLLNVQQIFWGSVVLPRGVTITAVRARVYRNAAGDMADVLLWRSTSTSATTLAHLTGATGGWTVQSASLSDLVGTEEYYIEVDLLATASLADARFAFVEIDYTMPSYDKGL